MPAIWMRSFTPEGTLVAVNVSNRKLSVTVPVAVAADAQPLLMETPMR
jgi:hypothetical protein